MDEHARAPLRDRLSAALRFAMKQNDRIAISAVRSALGAIANAEAVPSPGAPRSTAGPFAGARSGLCVNEVPRRDLSEDEIAAVVRTEIEERRAAARVSERGGPVDRVARLEAEADELERQLEDP